MDFNRNSQSQPVASSSAQSSVPASSTSRKNNKSGDSKWARIGAIAGVAAAVILLLGLITYAATSKTNADEQKLVDTSKLQAVFLSTGQVYFGNIKELNPRFFVVDNIYYLQTASTGEGQQQTTANTSVSLVKLGCELHSPFDKMVINRAQVTFWENLQDDGQVAKAVKTFKEQNPDGQKCSDNAAGASTTNNVQGGANTSTPTGTTNNSTAPATNR